MLEVENEERSPASRFEIRRASSDSRKARRKRERALCAPRLDHDGQLREIARDGLRARGAESLARSLLRGEPLRARPQQPPPDAHKNNLLVCRRNDEMRTTIAAATFLVVGAGAIGVSALDLKGSDTLEVLT